MNTLWLYIIWYLITRGISIYYFRQIVKHENTARTKNNIKTRYENTYDYRKMKENCLLTLIPVLFDIFIVLLVLAMPFVFIAEIASKAIDKFLVPK